MESQKAGRHPGVPADAGRMEDAGLDEVFDTDYEYFIRTEHTEEFNRKEADVLIAAGSLRPGMRVLDAACGYGRMSLELARRGMYVHGIDRSRPLVSSARAQVVGTGLPATFDIADLRDYNARHDYQAALMWHTSFGYGSDADSRRILENLYRALRAGGSCLVIDAYNSIHQQALFAAETPRLSLRRAGADFMLDELTLDERAGRLAARRTVVRDRTVRECRWSIRLLTPTEYEGWLRGAGFAHVHFLGADGRPFDGTGRRLLVVART